MNNESLPIVFINCRKYAFINWIMAGAKIYETRNKNTLKSLIGKRVYIAETGKGKRPIIKCIATIDSVLIIDNFEDYNNLRDETMIEKNSVFDWKQETKRKYLYKLSNIEKISAFIPKEGKRHGFVWMEYAGKENQ